MEYKTAKDRCTFADVLELASTYIKAPESIGLLRKAYSYVTVKHAGQKRKSGEPYTVHLIWVAYILCTLQTGPATIASGLLHDVMEDCGVSHKEMVDLFGEEITSLVEGVTKINKLPSMEENEIYAENHRKIYIAMAKDIRVILIKLADRLHNMRTLEFMPPAKQQRIAKETLEVYAPIAHRLGISDIRIELEDLSLSYLDPIAYKNISDLLDQTAAERQAYIDKMMMAVRNILTQNNMEFRIKGRAKHIYSIYKKMFQKNKRFDELYDLNALRIIVPKKSQCYEVLGIIHEHYRPLPGRFKDYIAMPKPNLYQSLHTAVIGEGGNIFEIQIRTEEMDEIAERGIAAHWRYKEGKPYSAKEEQKEIGEKLQWMAEFITMSDENKDDEAVEFYNTLKRDIFEANVYIFTPQGKIVELPNGSTPIDFAYRIHTEVGNHAFGAIVNNVMVPINSRLNTGDVCEIKTNKNASPSEDWLKFVKTASARNKIRQYLARQEAEDRRHLLEEGKRLLKDEMKLRQLDDKYLTPEPYRSYMGSFGAKNFDELLISIGKRNITAYQVLEKVAPVKRGFFDNLSKMLKKNQEAVDRTRDERSIGIGIKNVSGVKMQLSKCCNPIPGDEIVGFVSKGQGIKVHRRDCPNVQNVMKNRLISVYWDYAGMADKRYTVDLELLGLKRATLLSDVVNMMGSMKANILSINAQNRDLDAIIKMSISVESAEVLQKIIDNLHKIQGIASVKRIIY